MGLNLYHYKASKSKPDNLNPTSDNYVTKNDLEDFYHVYKGFDVEIDFFKEYLSIIEIPKTVETLIFLKREETEIDNWDYFKKSFEESRSVIVKDIKIDIQNYIVEYQKEKNSIYQHYCMVTKDWDVVYLFEWFKTEGFYFEEVGHQRKGMSKQFYDKHYQHEFYNFTSIKESEFFFTCISHTDEREYDSIVDNFKRNFLNNYEEGRSWLSVDL